MTIQPIQARPAGGYDPATDRLTVSEVRRMIIDQSEVFTDADILPVPCHPDCLAMGYALKLGGEVAVDADDRPGNPARGRQQHDCV